MAGQINRILTYKRTHVGDPDPTGVFGHADCMGRVRSYAYDAVIGVGGTGFEPRQHGIAGKLTWVGVGPQRTFGGNGRAETVTFDDFVLLDSNGPDLIAVAPNLARRVYEGRPRYFFNHSEAEYAEALALIERALKGEFGGMPPPGTGPRGCRVALGARCRPRRVICYPKKG
jgi:hypothetical protein